jgi:hypothetical protein
VYTKPVVLPLTDDGFICDLFDQSGRQIAAGSLEVCQTLFYLLTSSPLMEKPPRMARNRTGSTPE